MMYQVRVLNDWGVWMTDTTCGRRGRQRALDRARFLIPRTNAVQVLDRDGKRVDL